MKQTTKTPKNPLAFLPDGRSVTIRDTWAFELELFDSPALGSKLVPVAIDSSLVQTHFRLVTPERAARGAEGQPDNGEAHTAKQREYEAKGYETEVTLLFPDDSKYVVDCFHRESRHIVEVVDEHGDLPKARVLHALGFDVLWHFISSSKFKPQYFHYGTVIRDYKD